MTKRLALAVAAVAAAAATAAPASAEVWVETCYQTIHMPCAVCVNEGPVYHCQPV